MTYRVRWGERHDGEIGVLVRKRGCPTGVVPRGGEESASEVGWEQKPFGIGRSSAVGLWPCVSSATVVRFCGVERWSWGADRRITAFKKIVHPWWLLFGGPFEFLFSFWTFLLLLWQQLLTCNYKPASKILFYSLDLLLEVKSIMVWLWISLTWVFLMVVVWFSNDCLWKSETRTMMTRLFGRSAAIDRVQSCVVLWACCAWTKKEKQSQGVLMLVVVI